MEQCFLSSRLPFSSAEPSPGPCDLCSSTAKGVCGLPAVSLVKELGKQLLGIAISGK